MSINEKQYDRHTYLLGLSFVWTEGRLKILCKHQLIRIISYGKCDIRVQIYFSICLRLFKVSSGHKTGKEPEQYTTVGSAGEENAVSLSSAKCPSRYLCDEGCWWR